jgi:hypothetical protein
MASNTWNWSGKLKGLKCVTCGDPIRCSEHNNKVGWFHENMRGNNCAGHSNPKLLQPRLHQFANEDIEIMARELWRGGALRENNPFSLGGPLHHGINSNPEEAIWDRAWVAFNAINGFDIALEPTEIKISINIEPDGFDYLEDDRTI